jgi:four helix bundle protein
MHKNSDLRNRTKRFASKVIQFYPLIPKTTVGQILGRQLLRASTSVGANYREASRARSKAEFVSKAGDCLKEIDETTYWLELLEENDVVSKKPLNPLMNEANELTAIFASIINNAKAN